MPNLNAIPAIAIAVVATALLSIAGTSAVHQFFRFGIPAADPPALSKLLTDTANRLDGRITETLGNAILCVEEVQAMRKERTPSRTPAPVMKKAGG